MQIPAALFMFRRFFIYFSLLGGIFQALRQEHAQQHDVLPANLNIKEFAMSGTTDKIKGIANETIGKAKQGIGEATGSDRLQGEGALQEAKGHAQKAVGDAKNATKEAVDKAADAAKRNL
jgi:uncharacterized protein YjbJ (UPF0337 family)